jgi:hypothetical protein
LLRRKAMNKKVRFEYWSGLAIAVLSVLVLFVFFKPGNCEFDKLEDNQLIIFVGSATGCGIGLGITTLACLRAKGKWPPKRAKKEVK